MEERERCYSFILSRTPHETSSSSQNHLMSFLFKIMKKVVDMAISSSSPNCILLVGSYTHTDIQNTHRLMKYKLLKGIVIFGIAYTHLRYNLNTDINVCLWTNNAYPGPITILYVTMEANLHV
jgi:hypothetical protein